MIDLRFFYHSAGEPDGVVLSNELYHYQKGFDWKLIVGNKSSDILDFIANSELFSKKKAITHYKTSNSMKIHYRITEEELVLLMLQYS